MPFTTLEGPTGTPVTAKADADDNLLVAIAGGVTVTGGATATNQDEQEVLQASTNSKLDSLKTYTDGLEAGQTVGNAALASVVSQTDGLEGSSSAIATNTTDANTKLDTLLSQTDGLEGAADTTATQSTAIAGSVDQLEGYVNDLEGSSTTTATNTGTTATNTAAISGALVSSESTYSSLGVAVAATLKSGSGKVWALFLGNLNASTTLYAWVYDALSATGAPIIPPIPLSAGAWYGIGSDLLTTDGKSFSTGLTVGFSTSRSTYSAHSTAADCHAGGFGS